MLSLKICKKCGNKYWEMYCPKCNKNIYNQPLIKSFQDAYNKVKRKKK